MPREETVFSVRSGRTVLLSILCAATLLLPAFCRAEEGTGRVLTIGKTDSIAPKAEQQLLPIVQYLAGRLAAQGIDEGQVLIRDSKEELAGQLREGNLDIVFSSPYPTVFYSREAGTIPVLLGSRHGLLAYHSKIFVRQDSGLSGMADLSGKVKAFEDPGSTSEYFLPRFTMESEGLELVEMSSLDERPPPGKVGFIFSHDELNISSWVFPGKVDAGVTRIIVDIDSIGEELLVSVADQGDGIPDQFKESVFERFKRGKKKGVKGSGLGLAIARRIVRFNGGRIWVEDAPEGGSVFFVRVPKGFPAA